MILTVWGMLVRLLCKIFLYQTLSDILLMLSLGQCILGRKMTKENCWFHQIISSVHAITLIMSRNVDLDHLAKVVFVSLLHCKVILPHSAFLHCILWKEVTIHRQNLRRRELCSPPWVRNILWRRKWQPTPVLLPGKSHGWRSMVGYSPQGRKESDTTERLHFTSLPWGQGIPWWLSPERTCLKCRRQRRCEFDPWVRRTSGEGNDNPFQYSCLGNPMDWGDWWATVHEVAKRRTQLSD